GCSNRDQLEAARLEKKEEAVPVKVEKVVLKDMEKTLEYVGNIKAMDEAQVYPKVSGKIIEKIKEEGSQVNKGDVIAYIDRDEVGFTFEKAPVESPLTGVVGRMYVDIGTSVGVGTPIALVIDTKQMIIELSIPERYLPEVSVGERARITVDAFPGDEFSGKITKVSPVLDLETRSAPIEVTIENTEAKLQSGMFARVNLVIDEKKDAVVVIKEAILGSADKTYCFIAEDNKAVLRTIKTGLRQGSFVEVVEGLKAGNLVVIMGQQKLNDGTPVVVEED
ncbi:MAG TPA: efflux RND transporter periplasmic adaptor subunit, partial [Candidatus Omnitrophota bacterium]|nr:efflux RND transporter periplasmic adaptor subunit [Candidatus Omnitrophota bacterium]